jgi:hypothetical protein
MCLTVYRGGILGWRELMGPTNSIKVCAYIRYNKEVSHV